MRRCYDSNLVGGFDQELKLRLNKIVGDFKLLRRSDESRTVRLLTADGSLWGSVNHGQSAFSSADSPCQILQNWSCLPCFNVD